MHRLFVLLLLAVSIAAQESSVRHLSSEDAVRIAEFYRLSSSVQEHVWQGWGDTPSPLLLVTSETEFLAHHASPPKDFAKISDDFYFRPRQFPTNLQATFPAFGPPAVIVIGEPVKTASKSSTPWLFTLMHEHFHQLQWAQPGYLISIEGLDLSHGDTTGMWMLNYPFPYEDPEIGKRFSALRDLLLQALAEQSPQKFRKLATEYIERRHQFFVRLSDEDHRYFSFQLWQEGIARYTEVKSAEAARNYHPAEEYSKLADYESFSQYADEARAKTLGELEAADLASWKRTVVYSFGAAEGFLLDRIDPQWSEAYFRNMLSMDPYFQTAK